MEAQRAQEAIARLYACAAVALRRRNEVQGRGCTVPSMRQRRRRRLSMNSTNSTSKQLSPMPLAASSPRRSLRCRQVVEGAALTTASDLNQRRKQKKKRPDREQREGKEEEE